MPSRRQILAGTAGLLTAGAGCSIPGIGSRKAWTTTVDQFEVLSPLVSFDGRLYVTAESGRTHALTAAGGSAEWTQQFQGRARTGPARHERTLYLGNADLLTVDVGADDGWELEGWLELLTAGEQVTAFSAGPDRVIVGTDQGGVYGMETSVVSVAWERDVGDDGVAVETIERSGERVVIAEGAGVDRRLVVLDAANGDEQWHRSIGGLFDGAVTDDHVVVGDGERLVGFDAATGEMRWRRSDGPYESLVGDGQRVYAVTSDDAALRSIDATTGDRDWSVSLDRPTKRGVPPTVADEHVYVPEYTAKRVTAVTTDGKRAWTFDTSEYGQPRTRPHYAEETVYVGVAGTVLALDA